MVIDGVKFIHSTKIRSIEVIRGHKSYLDDDPSCNQYISKANQAPFDLAVADGCTRHIS